MFASFLPPSATDIKAPEAIALLQELERRVVQVPFEGGTTALAQLSVGIATACIHQLPGKGLTSHLNTVPILLLHGFDRCSLVSCGIAPLKDQPNYYSQ